MRCHCRHCGYGDFRPSRFRWYDVPLLLLLMRPMRCRYCGLRRHVFLAVVRREWT